MRKQFVSTIFINPIIMIKQKCTRLERCEVNLQHKKYRGIWLAGVKFFERDEPREELLEYSTFYAVVHCLVICLVHFVVRRNTIQYVIVWSTDSSVRLLERFKIIGGYLKQVLCCVCGLARLHLRSWSYPWLTAVICEWNWMESWLFMILERTRSN